MADAVFLGVIPVPVPIDKGGTGQVTSTASFDAIAPTQQAGDLIYFNGTTNVRLEAGKPGWTLQMNAAGDAPEWVKV